MAVMVSGSDAGFDVSRVMVSIRVELSGLGESRNRPLCPLGVELGGVGGECGALGHSGQSRFSRCCKKHVDMTGACARQCRGRSIRRTRFFCELAGGSFV